MASAVLPWVHNLRRAATGQLASERVHDGLLDGHEGGFRRLHAAEGCSRLMHALTPAGLSVQPHDASISKVRAGRMCNDKIPSEIL
jgi:hypothetical protein